MFNNAKKNKKLPKFAPGGTMNFDEFGNPIQSTNSGSATSNLYNEKRNSGLTNQQKNDMYAAIGAAGTSYAMSNNQAAYNDPNYKINNSSKGAWQSQGSSEGVADSIQSGVSSAIPIAGLFHGISESAQSAVGTQGANAGAQYFFEPHKLITHAIDGEGLFNAKDREEHGLGKLNNLTHAYGGVNMAPNAEVEKQENTLNPDGSSTQFNGPSHENGGIPTNLDPGTLIFSDKLKHMGKTFASLNKANNTSKEDKILNDPTASKSLKETAQLMKEAKVKNSLSLFKIQEDLKQAKLDSYTKRLGGIQKYPYGGNTDNTKFTPAQRQQAYADSMTLYKSGFNKNIPNWKTPGFNEAVGRLTDLNGVAPQSTDRSSTAYANDSNYLAKRSVPYAKPTEPVIQTPVVKSKPVYGNVNMPMKGLENNVDINPQLQTVPANRPNTIKTNIVTGPNMSYKEYKQGNEVLDRAYFDPSTKKEIELSGFRYGGKLPRYGNSGNKNSNNIDSLTARQQQEYNMWYNANRENEGFNPDEYSVDAYKNQYLYEEPTQRVSNQTSANGMFNRNSDAMYQAGFQVAQNLGQMAYLAEQGKKYDKQNYYEYKPNTLDPTMDLHDAEMQNLRAEYNVRGASGGNAGTYLSNRVALNAQNTMNKSRIHQAYANANAGILNQASQLNLQNKYAVDDINARNKGQALTNYYSTLGSLGTNVAQGMKDNKATNTDYDTAELLSKLYNSPEAQKMFSEYLKTKKSKGK